VRSRDGNHPFLLAICSLVLSVTLNAESFYISYKTIVKDAVVVSQKLYISPAMIECKILKNNKPLILIQNDNETLDTMINRELDLFLEYMSKHSLHVKSSQSVINSQSKDLIELSFAPTCFTVNFNDGFVRISPTK